jgi:hypothetical protein
MADQMCTVTSLDWTPDSRVVIVSGTDGTVWGWNCHSGVLAGCFQSLAVTSYAAVDEHDQGVATEWFELPGVWCAACHFTASAAPHPKPKLKDAQHFQTTPMPRRLSNPKLQSPLGAARGRPRTPEAQLNIDPSHVQPASPGRKGEVKL